MTSKGPFQHKRFYDSILLYDSKAFCGENVFFGTFPSCLAQEQILPGGNTRADVSRHSFCSMQAYADSLKGTVVSLIVATAVVWRHLKEARSGDFALCLLFEQDKSLTLQVLGARGSWRPGSPHMLLGLFRWGRLQTPHARCWVCLHPREQNQTR